MWLATAIKIRDGQNDFSIGFEDTKYVEIIGWLRRAIGSVVDDVHDVRVPEGKHSTKRV